MDREQEQLRATETSPGEEKAHNAQQEPSPQETAVLIARQLDETEGGPIKSIAQIVQAGGRTQAYILLEKAMQIEEQGGLLVPDGSRRRTPGGVFFYLAFTTGMTLDGKRLRRFPPKAKKRPSAPAAQPVQLPPFTWKDRIAVIQKFGPSKGSVTVKITLIGTIETFVDKCTCVVAVVQSGKVPPLAKGLPVPAELKTTYVVYIATKQWKTIAACVKDPEDTLVIEGFPQIDLETNGSPSLRKVSPRKNCKPPNARVSLRTPTDKSLTPAS